MKVEYTPRAREDLVAILSYIEQRSPQGARNVARGFYRTIELIGEFPQAGRVAGEQATRALPVGHYPYVIYWNVEGDRVWIVHIRHTARRPWSPD
ncbi:MAG: type II toxin-antitoxin system RelE/ParE family toxin [Xanthobacteraceae bacterium]